jgi:hypothetical protein
MHGDLNALSLNVLSGNTDRDIGSNDGLWRREIMHRRGVFAVIAVLLLFMMILAAPAGADGPVGSRILIRNNTGLGEIYPSVAYNSQMDEYLVVWNAGNEGNWGKFVDANGRVSRSAFQISTAGASPDVAYNSLDNEYMVVWHACGTNSVCGVILTAVGTPVTTEFTIAYGYADPGGGGVSRSHPSVTHSPASNRYLVVFATSSYGMFWSTYQIDARGYLADGSPEDDSFVVADSMDHDSRSPDATYNPSRNEFLVVWQMEVAGDFDVYGRRIEEIGTLGPLGLEFPIAEVAAEHEANPAVAALPTNPGEGRYLVAWDRGSDVYAAPVSGTGAVGSAQTVADSTLAELNPAVAGSQAHGQFLVSWTASVDLYTPPGKIQGRKLTREGTLLGTLQNITGYEANNSNLAAGALGDFLIVFDDIADAGLTDRGIYGSLWGERLYLPMVIR